MLLQKGAGLVSYKNTKSKFQVEFPIVYEFSTNHSKPVDGNALTDLSSQVSSGVKDSGRHGDCDYECGAEKPCLFYAYLFYH